MDPDTTNCVILRIHVDTRSFLAAPSSGKLVLVGSMGVKKLMDSDLKTF